MVGVLDQINRETISGWIFGDVNSLHIEIDGRLRLDIVIKSVERKDVVDAYPDRSTTGFEISSPLDIVDGRLHEISLCIDARPLENSPKKFRYIDRKILFVHIPKTGGSSVIDSLSHYKSSKGEDHIQRYIFSQTEQRVGVADADRIGWFEKLRINRQYKEDNKIEKDLIWLAGHVSPFQAKKIINSYYYKNEIRNLPLFFNGEYQYKTPSAIAGFELFTMVRNPIDQLISGLNWFYEIYHGRDPDFFYEHNLRDIGRISFYIANMDKTMPNILSKILNLNMLNSQCRYIAPKLFLEHEERVALDCLRPYKFVGRSENMDSFIKEITYPENDWPLFRTNPTLTKNTSWDDLDGNLKNFLYKRMKPDFLLYEAVQNNFS
jgi:hypothetical protein